MSSKLKFSVIPGPGMYGQGKVKVCSRHKTAEAANKAAEKATMEYREAMAKHGGTSGCFLAVEFEGSEFWSDCPPSAIK